MIAIKQVSKSFDGERTFAVRDLTLEVHPGETLILLGSSGCGKTTTLKMINRLVELTSGTIEVDGRDILQVDVLGLRRSIGYVFQGIGRIPAFLFHVPQLLDMLVSFSLLVHRAHLPIRALEVTRIQFRAPARTNEDTFMARAIARPVFAPISLHIATIFAKHGTNIVVMTTATMACM